MITPKCVPLLLSVAAAVLGTAGCTSDGYIDGSDGNNTGIIQSRPCNGVLLKGSCIPSGTLTVQGVVFDAYNGPRGDMTIDVRVLLPDGSGYLYSDAVGYPVVTDSLGRFKLTELPESKVLLRSGSRDYRQPCVHTVDVHGDALHDIEVVSADTLNSLAPPRPLNAPGLTMTGTVFVTTSTGKQAVVGAVVELEESYLIRADTVTDLSGRYFLCNVPSKDVAFGVYAPGFAAKYIEPVDTSQATFDIELTPQ